jgi:hypothetical protein
MILKASQRGGARQLASHLTNEKDNQHVELYDLRGFISNDLSGALSEAHSISKATQCKQFMFSISLSPPSHEDVPPEVFESTLKRIEVEFGMEDQPRALVFHEKDARRHMHAVYSRIDTNQMKAVNLPFFKNKMQEISREVFLEQGWKVPRGLMQAQERDVSNYSLQEYQQAKRAGRDPKIIKAAFQEAWNISDGTAAFKNALEERGYFLAKGDRRGFVAMDHTGEVYSVARWAGVRTKSVKERLGEPKHLPSIEETKEHIAQKMKPALKRMIAESSDSYQKQKEAQNLKRSQITEVHRTERKKIDALHQKREQQENQQRMERMRSGLLGVWDRLTGTYQRTRKQNESELVECKARDASERQKLITRQLDEQRNFQRFVQNTRFKHTAEVTRLMRDIEQYREPTQMAEQEHKSEYRNDYEM